MKYIALIAVIGILLLQLTGAIPLSSVGGPMTIALASAATTAHLVRLVFCRRVMNGFRPFAPDFAAVMRHSSILKQSAENT